MHMADALISPAVGGATWTAAAALTAVAARKLRRDPDEARAPLMGVLGAFVFAAQMINFTIPATGSSGHLVGSLLLAILLGPYAGFLTMVSILIIQALFFADGGLLALGCNIINMGAFPCFIAYPLIYRRLAGGNPTPRRLAIAIILASIIGLQLGALGVVLETMLSGITDLPFAAFLLLMLPIHLAIGIVEGLVSAAVILFVWKGRPELILSAGAGTLLPQARTRRLKPLLVGLLLFTAGTAGILSWFASAQPDGLEWSVAKVSGQRELTAPYAIHSMLADLQQKTAFLPGYNFKDSEPAKAAGGETAVAQDSGRDHSAGENSPNSAAPAWPAIDAGTSLAGIVGSIITLILAWLIAKGLKFAARQP